jgi:predicted nucleotidyltransferase component of viral defense system
MLSPDELTKLSNKGLIAKIVVLREYCQLILLTNLTTHTQASHFVFKGGTAIRFLFDGHRFSEDLDFTVQDLTPDKAGKIIESIINDITDAGDRTLKLLKTLSGKSYRLTWKTPLLDQPITIKIDLSFRENVQLVKTSLLKSVYPVINTNYIYHLDKSEIVAEKVRAIMHRQKGRDLYDLWYLLSMQADFDENLIIQKMAFYQETYSKLALQERMKSFPQDIFVNDLAPFLSKKDRDQLPSLYLVIQDYLKQKLV